ncbi:unnamed protein product [Pylaiella littoralis]
MSRAERPRPETLLLAAAAAAAAAALSSRGVPPSQESDAQGTRRAGSPKGEGGKYDNVSCVLARTIRSNLHQEAAKLIGCTGMGNQCKRGQCFARAMQMFPGKGMDRIPTEVVLALLRH